MNRQKRDLQSTKYSKHPTTKLSHFYTGLRHNTILPASKDCIKYAFYRQIDKLHINKEYNSHRQCREWAAQQSMMLFDTIQTVRIDFQ